VVGLGLLLRGLGGDGVGGWGKNKLSFRRHFLVNVVAAADVYGGVGRLALLAALKYAGSTAARQQARRPTRLSTAPIQLHHNAVVQLLLSDVPE